jgi:CHAT domain-containing protein/tetratricopeptide (TPR) repeat protein
MPRTASRLSLIVVATLCLQPLGLAQEASPADETALRAAAEEFYAAYAKEDLEGLMGLWSSNAPDLASRRKAMQDVFAANEKIEVKRLTVRTVKLEGDKASLRIGFEMNAVDVKTGKPAENSGNLIRALHLIKEGGTWKVWRYAPAAADLAAALIAAKSDGERAPLLAAEKELVTPELPRALSIEGDRRSDQGNYAEALRIYQLAQTIADQIGDKAGTANALYRIGKIHRRKGDLALALEYYEKSLPRFEALDNKAAAADALLDIGIIYRLHGNNVLSLEYYQKSLKVSAEANYQQGVARALRSVGFMHSLRGDFGLALENLKKSFALNEALQNKAGIAESLRFIGVNYILQGNYALAQGYLQKSLTLYEALGNRTAIADTLNDIGATHKRQGDYKPALDYYQRSLAQKEALGDKEGIAIGHINIGGTLVEQGNYDLALDHLQKSVALLEAIGLKAYMGHPILSIAEVHYRQQRYVLALDFTERAASLVKQLNDRDVLWRAQNDAGRIYQALNQPARARQSFDEAIATIESMRVLVAGGEQGRQRFFEGVVSPYNAMVELLVTQGKTSEALAYAERAKARALLDVLHSGRVNITKAMSAQERERERGLAGELVSLNSGIQRENLRAQPDQTRLADLKARLQKARLEYEAFQTGLYATHPELKAQRGEAKPMTLEETAGLLPDAQSALLEYVVTDEKTHLFVLSKENGNKQGAVNLKAYTLPIKRKELADHAAAFRQQLAKRDLTFRQAASRLYDLLLKPAQAELQGKQTLVIVPDGALWELPFQALLDSQGRYLIEDHALSYAPSLTVLREMAKLRRRKADDRAASTTLLAMGNPALGKETVERVKLIHRDEKLAPLPEAEKEVKTVAGLYGAARSQVYVGAEAREDRVKAEAGRFSVLHLATHGILNDASPMYSQVVLAQSAEGESEDGLLEAWEIMNLDLNADLVVLSACETGRGRIGAGEGVIGLTWALFVAGSPTTVVSQWKVESASTTRLMLEFHRNLQPKIKKSQVSTAKALQRAAVKMLGSADYRHPFYWAGFVVVGDGG